MTSRALLVCALLLVTGCVSRQADHFYVLDALPPGAGQPGAVFNRQITLRVSVPSLVDRAEMVLSTQNGVVVPDHERWAAPLADLMTTTLGQDIERRRPDMLVLPRSVEQARLPLVKIAVDVDQVTARLGDQVRIEVHWRISDTQTGTASLGREVFTAELHSSSYAAVADGLSSCISQLADRLAAQLAPR
jgi:uncharacterized protein